MRIHNAYLNQSNMVQVKEHKFKLVDGEFDSCESQRVISGKITKRRRKMIEHIVRSFNKKWEAPYGYSHNGYAYRCGCIHDCCGCLVSKGMWVEFKKIGNNHIAVLNIYESFNY
jgi:hypothetical protein